MDSIREWLSGKKLYFTAILAIATAIGGYADGAIDLVGLITAIFAAASAIFLRTGSAKAEAAAKSATVAANTAASVARTNAQP